MKLLEQFNNSLFHPSRVINDKEYKKGFTFLYYIILALLYMVPSFLGLFLSPIISYNDEVMIRRSIQAKKAIPYMIQNGQLKYLGSVSEDNNTIIDMNTYSIVFTESDEYKPKKLTFELTVVFERNDISILVGSTKIKVLNYLDYSELDDLDFRLADENDIDFWNTIFNVFDKVEKANHNLYIIISSFSIVFYSLIRVLMITLFLTLITRFMGGKTTSFIRNWQLTIFFSTALVLGNVFASLFGIVLISYIGLIVTIGFVFKIE